MKVTITLPRPNDVVSQQFNESQGTVAQEPRFRTPRECPVVADITVQIGERQDQYELRVSGNTGELTLKRFGNESVTPAVESAAGVKTEKKS